MADAGTPQLATRFSHTTRVPGSGTHAVDVLVNGTAYPAGSFTVVKGA